MEKLVVDRYAFTVVQLDGTVTETAFQTKAEAIEEAGKHILTACYLRIDCVADGRTIFERKISRVGEKPTRNVNKRPCIARRITLR